MKLALCLFKYFPYGGLQRDFLRIARVLQDRGHEIHVYTQRWHGEVIPGLNIHLLKTRGVQNHTRLLHFVNKLAAKLRKQKFDLVIGFNKMPGLDIYYAADTCFQLRAKQKHGWFYRLLPRYRQYLAFEKAVFSPQSLTKILTLSSVQQKEYNQCYHTPASRFHLLPPGISKDRIAPLNALDIREAKRAQYQISSQQFLLLMVGSGFKTKGLDRALQALAALPPPIKERTTLFVIGDDKEQTFQRLALQLNIGHQVKFLGGRDDVPDFLLAADLLLHPAYHENTGTVLLEALAAGLPVLTTAICGYAHYVDQAKAGIVLNSPFKQTELNTTLAMMLTAKHYASWQQNGLAFAKTTDIYALPEKAADFIEQVGKQKNLDPALPKDTTFFCHEDIQKYFSPHKPLFDQIMALRGENFRQQDGRFTERLQLGEKFYFIKRHTGVGVKEIVKNILQLRLPIVSAKNEWLAIQQLQMLGIKTAKIAAFGERGSNPAKRESFILLEEIAPAMSLETVTQHWLKQPPSREQKHTFIKEVAHIANTLHQNGMNHRDFYLCHFLLNENNRKLYLIDLHRAQIRRLTPERWIIKDLAGLYFSSKQIGLTERDLYRFIRYYRKKSLKQIVTDEKMFWQKVKERGEQLYRDHGN